MMNCDILKDQKILLGKCNIQRAKCHIFFYTSELYINGLHSVNLYFVAEVENQRIRMTDYT